MADDNNKKPPRQKRSREPVHLPLYFGPSPPEPHELQMGVDEAGRGPLFGRVYAAAVALPSDPAQFDGSRVKDSKKYHSEAKILEAAEYVRSHALAWSVCWRDEAYIDEHNILQATQSAMQEAMHSVLQQQSAVEKVHLLVDGNYLNPMIARTFSVPVRYDLIEGGDNAYASIAAASILAKVARDQYIQEMCVEHPELDEKYGLLKNKGYGTKQHVEGIRQHGTSVWHRKSFRLKK